MLAAILTIKGEYDMPSHDLLDMASAYAAVHLAGGRRLSTMAVLHVPGDGLSTARQHVHLCVLARQHLPSGWAGEHPDLADTAHRLAGAYPTIVHATCLDPDPLPALGSYVIT